LQDQEFQRLGGKETIKVDVRVIAATHCDLEKAITENHFRADLYYRLNVINIRVPPLRERREDIIPLSEFLLRKHTAPGALPIQIPPALKELFLDYNWPGNVRELENMIRKFLVFRKAMPIEQELRRNLQQRPVNGSALAATTPAAAPPPVNIPIAPPGATSVLEQVARDKQEAERAAIVGVLKSTNWNRKQASKLLQIDYKALLYRMKRLSITKEKKVPQSIQARAEAPSASAESMSPTQVSEPVIARRAIG
jgi:two-component system response regulator AtoC